MEMSLPPTPSLQQFRFLVQVMKHSGLRYKHKSTTIILKRKSSPTLSILLYEENVQIPLTLNYRIIKKKKKHYYSQTEPQNKANKLTTTKEILNFYKPGQLAHQRGCKFFCVMHLVDRFKENRNPLFCTYLIIHA